MRSIKLYQVFQRLMAVILLIEKVINEIKDRNNFLNMNTTIRLLNDVGVYYNGIDRLQWSVVYNVTNKTGKIWPHRNTKNIKDFAL